MAKQVGTMKKKPVKRQALSFGKTELTEAIYNEMQDHKVYDAKALPASCKEVTKTATEAIIDMVFATIESAVANGDKVCIVGHGTYEARERQARKGRNPQTGEEIEIEGKVVPAFKPGKTFKDTVKKAFEA